MTMTVAMPSSEASSSPSNKRGLRGPRPQPLKVTASPTASSSSSKPASGSKKPVIVYEHTPKVVHARPQEFMTVVQRLTGKPAPATLSSSLPPYVQGFSPAAAVAEEGGDPLLLTLGQGQAAPPPAPTTLPSPMAAGLLLSPGFIFSPNTMQAIQELSPLF
ncbi:protein MKS1-like [Panicum virgatum]|uniref:VQ domain-containing protein n=1 Tax=Panicum virgatum TaxID=38727 RepID=A0A8T0MHK9_PANVG|nr:protein MKS1-like [Panicum virgatum]KAG2534684.1 hypothetical protein PVAP13_9NG076140 [Panicum virgatum]